MDLLCTKYMKAIITYEGFWMYRSVTGIKRSTAKYRFECNERNNELPRLSAQATAATC